MLLVQNILNSVRKKKKSPVSGHRARCLRPILVGFFLAGSIGILQCCVFHNNRVHVFHWLAKIKRLPLPLPPPPPQKKMHVTAPILKLTFDQKPETFFYWTKRQCTPLVK